MRPAPGSSIVLINRFQFTHPGKGATVTASHSSPTSSSFNSRTLGRVRQFKQIDLAPDSKFQFTHPGKGATFSRYACPLLGSCFNSRTLGRVRHRFNPFRLLAYQFQFTHPGKGATPLMPLLCSECEFQFTHPGKGATLFTFNSIIGQLSFNSRTLGRVRLWISTRPSDQDEVSIHAPWEGCDYWCRPLRTLRYCFNSRTLGRVRLV